MKNKDIRAKNNISIITKENIVFVFALFMASSFEYYGIINNIEVKSFRNIVMVPDVLCGSTWVIMGYILFYLDFGLIYRARHTVWWLYPALVGSFVSIIPLLQVGTNALFYQNAKPWVYSMWATATAPSWIGSMILFSISILVGFIMFFYKIETPASYALVEFAVGASICTLSIHQSVSESNHFSTAIKVFGGIYVIVRGIENFKKNLTLKKAEKESKENSQAEDDKDLPWGI